MTNRDYEKEIREQWFGEHKATLRKMESAGGPPVFHLLWAKPGTNIFRIHYIVLGGTLMVTGDAGDAIYCWSPNQAFSEDPFACLANYGLHYFQEKCQASELGREYKEWFAEIAEQALNDQVENGLGEGLTKEEAKAKLQGDPADYQSSAYEHTSSAEDWGEWLKARGEEVFGDDDWYMMFDLGMGVAVRCRSHLIGITMAVEQLKGEG